MDVGEKRDTATIEEKRKRMFERLNARHTQNPAPSDNSASAIFGPKELDNLQVQAKALLDDPNAVIDPSFLGQIESVLSLLPSGFESRRLRDLHGELRMRLQQKTAQTSTFSFKKKHQSTPKPEVLVTEKSGYGSTKESSIGFSTSKRTIAVSDLIDETLDLKKPDEEDVATVSIMNVSGSKISVKFDTATVHLKEVKDSLVVLAPVQSSVMIRDCNELTLVVAAQQLRIHNTHGLRLHVAVRGAVIIEDCDDVQVAPYRLKGFDLDFNNSNWKDVKDFNWLAVEKHSPHWCVMSEDLWKTFDFNDL